MALVARVKSTSKQISEGSELCEAYIRKMLNTHQAYFQFTGYMLNERKNRKVKLYRVRPEVIETLNRKIDALQKLLKEGEEPNADTVQQVTYVNPYDQLFGNAHFIQCKKGNPIPFSEKNNARMSGKARHFVSGATLSA